MTFAGNPLSRSLFEVKLTLFDLHQTFDWAFP